MRKYELLGRMDVENDTFFTGTAFASHKDDEYFNYTFKDCVYALGVRIEEMIDVPKSLLLGGLEIIFKADESVALEAERYWKKQN